MNDLKSITILGWPIFTTITAMHPARQITKPTPWLMPSLNTMIGYLILNHNGMKRHPLEKHLHQATHQSTTKHCQQQASSSNNSYNRLPQWRPVKSKPLLQQPVHPLNPPAASTAAPPLVVPPLVTVPLPASEHDINGTSSATDVVSTSSMVHPGAPSLTLLQINTGPPTTTLLAATSSGTIYG